MTTALILTLCVAAASAAYNGPLAGGQPASAYPAGISPQACPNYPNCANPAVAVSPNALPPQQPQQQQYAGYQQQPAYVPQYNSPQQAAYNPQQVYNPQQQQPAFVPQQAAYNPQQPAYSPQQQNALDSGVYIGDGDYHGEGLAESGAFGAQPQAGYGQAAQQAAPAYNAAAYGPAAASHGQPAQVPAGVDPSSCPNYPFCG